MCIAAAAPSFLFGTIAVEARLAGIVGMLAAVGCWAVAYALLTSTAVVQEFRRRPFVERTIEIGLTVRVVQSLLSVVPPVALLDVFLGAQAVDVTNFIVLHLTRGSGPSLFDTSMTSAAPALVFVCAFVTAHLQGVLVNAVLFAFMLVVYASQRLFMKPPLTTQPWEICVDCGYDLRGSVASCPECGRAFPRRPGDSLASPRIGPGGASSVSGE